LKKIGQRLKEKAKRVKLLILDVDGVLTDNSLYIDDKGIEAKRFNVSDGMGIYLVMKSGIEVALISGRDSQATRIRARELNIKHAFWGVGEKYVAYKKIKDKLKIKDSETCFIGDDLLDVPVLKKVGLPVVVCDSNPCVKEYAEYTTLARGGEGAVREVIDLILLSKNINPGELL